MTDLRLFWLRVGSSATGILPVVPPLLTNNNIIMSRVNIPMATCTGAPIPERQLALKPSTNNHGSTIIPRWAMAATSSVLTETAPSPPLTRKKQRQKARSNSPTRKLALWQRACFDTTVEAAVDKTKAPRVPLNPVPYCRQSCLARSRNPVLSSSNRRA